MLTLMYFFLHLIAESIESLLQWYFILKPLSADTEDMQMLSCIPIIFSYSNKKYFTTVNIFLMINRKICLKYQVPESESNLTNI